MPKQKAAANGKVIESVWDYPRPPKLERVHWRIRVVHLDQAIVDAPWAIRVLETSQPPAYYVDPQFVDQSYLNASPSRTSCEWKGTASYFDVVIDGEWVPDAAWLYEQPNPAFDDLKGYFAFYAQKLDRCYVDEEQVDANKGGYYGGWITANVTGPFKGGPGTSFW